MKIKHISGSVKGIERPINKDYIFSLETENYYLFLLFDGVSSSNNAIKAIKYVKNFIIKNHNSYYYGGDFHLNKMILNANKYLLSKGEINGYTTCTGIIILPLKNTIKYINIGDSRIYMIGKQHIEQITKDDKLYLGGNIITKSLGMNLTIHDIHEFRKNISNNCNSFLICSDGFYELFEHNKIDFHEFFLMTYFTSMSKNIINKIKNNNSDDASYIYIKIM